MTDGIILALIIGLTGFLVLGVGMFCVYQSRENDIKKFEREFELTRRKYYAHNWETVPTWVINRDVERFIRLYHEQMRVFATKSYAASGPGFIVADVSLDATERHRLRPLEERLIYMPATHLNASELDCFKNKTVKHLLQSYDASQNYLIAVTNQVAYITKRKDSRAPFLELNFDWNRALRQLDVAADRTQEALAMRQKVEAKVSKHEAALLATQQPNNQKQKTKQQQPTKQEDAKPMQQTQQPQQQAQGKGKGKGKQVTIADNTPTPAPKQQGQAKDNGSGNNKNVRKRTGAGKAK